MSGGRFSYLDNQLKCEIFGYTDKPKNIFEDKEISELIFDVLDLIHEFDYYKSGDSGEEDYLAEKTLFKKKWFTSDREERVKHIIDESVEELRTELYKTFIGDDNSDT